MSCYNFLRSIILFFMDFTITEIKLDFLFNSFNLLITVWDY